MVSQPDTNSGSTNVIMTAASAMEALTRHFHEQQRAYVLSSLMENSLLAMQAAATRQLNEAPSQVVVTSKPAILGATTDSAMIVPTVPQLLFEQNNSCHATFRALPAAAAKDALFIAYTQALNGTSG